jgi:DNA-binding response OmpR family regulator
MDPKRALVVESEPEAQAMIRTEIERMGFVVETAVRYEDVLEALFVRTPGLVVLSLSLPCNSGYDVCEVLRAEARFADVQILVTSDRATPSEMAWAEDAGANAFLKKPFTVAQLTKYVFALTDPRWPSRPSVRRLRCSEVPLSHVSRDGGILGARRDCFS